MKCKFHVGQKVVCIDKNKWWHEGKGWQRYMPFISWSGIGPSKGEVCTVSRIGVQSESGEPSVALMEYDGKNGQWTGFNASLFRPLHDVSTTVEAIKRKAIDDASKAPGNVKPVRVKA